MARKPFTLIPEKMDAVVKAARHEFSQFGYSHASTNRICQAAQISKGALFHNFHSKENLFLFLIQDGIQTAESVFQQYILDHMDDTPYRELFASSFLVILRFIRQHPSHYKIYLRLIYDADVPVREDQKALEVIKAFTSSITDTLVTEGRKRSFFRAGLNDDIVRFLFNTVITRFVELHFYPHRDPGLGVQDRSDMELRKLIYELYDYLMNGLAGQE